jgi:hypothetical protein
VGGESEPTGGFGEPQEAHMFVNRRIAKFAALALAAGATAAAVEIGVQPVSAQTGSGRLCTTTNGRGYPDAVPPILAPPPCSALPAIRRQEAFEGQEFWYHPPANARYSMAEMNAYANEHK